MHLLVTRPGVDGFNLKARLEALNHVVSLAPVLDIVPLPVAAADVAGAQAVIATSRNALRALIASERAADLARGKRLFVVGSSSQAMAKAAGFTEIVSGPSDAAALAQIIIAVTADAPQTPLMYLCGDVTAYDLGAVLAKAGRRVTQRIVYRQVAVDVLPDDVRQALSLGLIGGVLLYSPRTAEVYARLVRAYVAQLANTVHFCLSPAVAAALANLDVPKAIAARPNTEEMLALVSQVAAVSGRWR